MTHRRILALGAALVAFTALGAACGAPKSSGFSPIPLGNIPDGLTETTTTTTTPPTTSTIEPESTTTIVPVPTTNPTESVTLYFVSGQQLASSARFLPEPAQTKDALLALALGPDNLAGWRTAIPQTSQFYTYQFRGVLTVDLIPEFFQTMTDPYDERLAVGQMVLTLTHLKGVSQVRFTINNEPISVPLGDGNSSDPGEVLVAEDYEMLEADAPPPNSSDVATTLPAEPPPESVPSSVEG